MAKMILLLFAVFALFQVQAAPGLYDRYFQDKARELSDFLDEPRVPRHPLDRLFDDSYSSPLVRRERCTDFNPQACFNFKESCAWSENGFAKSHHFAEFNTLCCLTCMRFRK